MECARKKVAFAALSTSAAEKEACTARLRALTVRAFNFAVRNGMVGLTRGKQYAELFEPFSRTPAEVFRGMAKFVETSGSSPEKISGAAKTAAEMVRSRVSSARGVDGENYASPAKFENLGASPASGTSKTSLGDNSPKTSPSGNLSENVRENSPESAKKEA